MHLVRDFLGGYNTDSSMTTFTALNGGDTRISTAHRGSPTSPPELSEQRPSVRIDGPPKPARESPDRRDSHYSFSREAREESPAKRKRSVSPESDRKPDSQSRTNGRAEPRIVHFADSERRSEQREDEHERYQKSWYGSQPREEQAQHDRRQDAVPVPTARSGDRDREMAQEGDTTQVEEPDYPVSSPEEDDSVLAYSGKNEPSRNETVIQSNPSKRKRNFSHRTKTGCYTCRRRKKKCDEAKPECTNCQRGGFVCAGYHPNGNRDYKTEAKPAALPLESKDPSYVPPGAYGMPQHQVAYAPHASSKRHSLPGYRGPTLQTDFPSNRPAPILHERTPTNIPTTAVTSPEGKMQALSAFTQAANSYATPTSAVSNPNTLKTPTSAMTSSTNGDYQRVGPLHEVPRYEPKTPHPDTPHAESPFSNTLPRLNALTPNGHLAPTSKPYVPSPLATTHPVQARERSQKEEMLAGNRFNPSDEELTLERQRCGAACWRFNNAINPLLGISEHERLRLFGDILDPKENINISPHQISPVISRGRVGTDVVIEGPFTCEYGYNIKIGNNVFIGRSCTILDPCEVTIGNNCHIGPNVSIYGASLSTDPAHRHGSKSTQVGKRTHIEDDVWIGGGAIILPGRRVGRGATVGAGTVVTRDVPPFTVATGNPCRIVRSVGV